MLSWDFASTKRLGDADLIARIVDCGLDLGTVTDNRRVLDQPVDVPIRHSRDLSNVEPTESPPERTQLAENDRPTEPDLEDTQVSASNIADSPSVRVPQTSSW